MTRWISRYCRLLEALMVIALALMVVLVFTNVVLRYAFDSGIAVSEELSRWLFVWLTFLGAIVALHERAHLGTDILVTRLSTNGKKICLGIGYVLMLFMCYLVFRGAVDQVKINLTSTSAAMEVSLAIFYMCGVVFSVSGAFIIAHDLYRLATGEMADSELLSIRESEEVAH